MSKISKEQVLQYVRDADLDDLVKIVAAAKTNCVLRSELSWKKLLSAANFEITVKSLDAPCRWTHKKVEAVHKYRQDGVAITNSTGE